MSETNKITLETLKLYASTDETRWVLTLPRVVGDRMVATDGRVLVEVSLDEVESAVLADLEVREGNFPNYRTLLDPEFEGEMTEFEMPALGERKVEWVECFDCRGKGNFENGMACEECDGQGRWEDGSKWIVRLRALAGIDQICVAGLYVEKVLRLPAVRWYLPRSAEPCHMGALRFRFGESGRGLLMPLRMDSVVIAKPKKSAREVLGAVIRREADDIGRGSSALTAGDVAELIRVLARMVEGKSVTKAMGAPGDWGYDSDLGRALMDVYKEGVSGSEG